MRPTAQQDDRRPLRPQQRRFFSSSSMHAHLMASDPQNQYQQQSQQRRPSRRGASGAFNRLRQWPQDPLQTYGLPSKGETRLNDFRIQESFYNKIVERYLKFCAASNHGDDLDKQFAALTIDASLQQQQHRTSSGLLSSKHAPKQQTQPNPAPLAVPLRASSLDDTQRPSMTAPAGTNILPSPELQNIIGAMRKLREGIVASRRTDMFSQRAYIFIIRAMILVLNWESYQPALLYLLQHIHPLSPLPSPELREFATYFVLDLACRQRDLNAAYVAKYAYTLKERRLTFLMKSLVDDDWVLFWRVRNMVDGYQRALMGFAEEAMRLHALKCIGRSYFTADVLWIERMTGNSSWDELVKGGVGWELEPGGKVVIRRPKAR